MIKTYLKLAVSAIAAGITWIFGGWSTLLIVACIFMLIDYITGLTAAAINRELNSAVGWKGILKKVLMLLCIGAGGMLDKVLPQDTIVCETIVCLYYIGNEGISIIENVGKAGVPIPQKLKALFEQLRDKGNKEDTE